MLRILVPLLLSSQTLALEPRDFRVPSIDFTQLSSTLNNAHNFELLNKLQENGIIALHNVPNFARLRHEYLRTAATCAVRAQKKGANFLLHRQLRDSTKRYTVSLESGRQLRQSLDESAELLVLCPEYVEVHAAFSLAVELAVANVGSALDATQRLDIVAERGAVAMTARQLLEDSVHLDHFHAYEAASSWPKVDNDSRIDRHAMSLALHTDNGVMSAMSAPEYFDVASTGTVRRRDTREQDAGLFIQTADGQVVRPVVHPDALLLMLGSGIEDWIKTSPPLHAVVHGMRYPRAVGVVRGEDGTKVLRAWFGKMLLLASHQVMDNSGLTFGQYANETTRYLAQRGTQDEAESFSAVACPLPRRLVASATPCAPKVCSRKSTASSTDLAASCQVTCNHAAARDVALCNEFCDCHESTSRGTMCWMLCVEHIAATTCPGAQECNAGPETKDLAMTCVGGTTPSSVPSSVTTPSMPRSGITPSSSAARTTEPLATPASATTTTTTGAGPEHAMSGTTEVGTTASRGTPVSGTTGLAESVITDAGTTDLASSGSEGPEVGTTQSGTTESGPAELPTNNGDDITPDGADSTRDPSSTSPSSSESSSGASVDHIASFLNAAAVVVAAYLI